MRKRKIRYFIYLIVVLFTTQVTSCTSRSKLEQIAEIARSKANTPAVTPVPGKTISKDDEKQIINIDNRSNELKPPTPVEGTLIQTGGRVTMLASELTINMNISGSNVSQIIAMQNYIQNNWHYIHDPYRDRDTWRSAEATIALRYKGKFPGDCDDFAILMASLARQIGLDSRMVGGYYNGEGHAFAEFRVPENEYRNSKLNNVDYRKGYDGYWVSLDWFKGRKHNRYTNDIEIFEDI